MRYRWTILATATAAQTAGAMLFQGLPAIGPQLRDSYGLTVGETGIALSAVVVGMTLTLLAWGSLSDRRGERVVISIGLVGAAAAMLGAALITGFTGLFLCLFVAGLFVASANAASGRATMGWFASRERGLALGIRQASMPVGVALSGLLLPALAAGGTRVALLGLGAVLVAAAFATALLLRPPPERLERGDAGQPLRDRRIWNLAEASALLVCVQFAFLGFLTLYLHDTRGFSPAAAAATLAALQLLGATIRIALGRASDRLGLRIAPLRWVALALAAGTVLSGAAEIVGSNALLPVVLGCAVVAASWNGLAFTATAELAGAANSGTALGFQNTVMSAISGTTLATFGWLVTASSWAAGFALLALPALGASLLLRRVPEPRSRATV
jgi:sugar phosphate permease